VNDLDRLAAYLRRGPATAKQIAAHLGCSIPTAYARVRELSKTESVRVARVIPFPLQTGPVPKGYVIQ
jgi:DNA-binding CsgD family transcriptional regulator